MYFRTKLLGTTKNYSKCHGQRKFTKFLESVCKGTNTEQVHTRV